MNFSIEYEQEEDGRWLAEVIGLPGVLAYGNIPDEVIFKVKALALRVLVEEDDLSPEYDLNKLRVRKIGPGRKKIVNLESCGKM